MGCGAWPISFVDFIEGIGAGACEGAPALLLLGGQMASTGGHDMVSVGQSYSCTSRTDH